MIRNYLKVAMRNILRAPIYFFINLLGLAVAVASCLLIAQHVHFELGYDRQIPNVNRTFRLVSAGFAGGSATTPAPLGPLMAEEFAVVETQARVCPLKGTEFAQNRKHVFLCYALDSMLVSMINAK